MPNHIPLEVGPLEAEVHHATLGVAYAIVDLLYRYLCARLGCARSTTAPTPDTSDKTLQPTRCCLSAQ